MAKRGYRGKHPHNDMKVSNPSTTKYSAKLNDEYKKLKNNKQKYDYIRTHYYYPQSTATITVNGNVANNENIVITSTDGTSVAYRARADEDLTATPPDFDRNASNANIAASIKDCVNSANGHAGKIVATVDSNVVTLTQLEPGPDGDTSLSGSATNVTASNQAADLASINGSFSF